MEARRTKVILCYGDSNTWGHDPSTGTRLERDERWPGVLQKILGSDYYVIEEGLPGRTAICDDPIENGRNGKTYLLPCLRSHRPIDLVIIMLGTNDLKKRFSLSAFDIAAGIGVLIDIVEGSNCGRGGRAPKILVLAPPPLRRPSELKKGLTEVDQFEETFGDGIEKSRKLSKYIERIAKERGCEFFNTSTIIQTSEVDGVHLDREAHLALGRTVADIVKRII
ncbi:MAG: SGNH/GDSL hydrolase family protein [Candidatus Bathyarchaeota archaeon]|nr:SGNH/GDSL hydrolase family protein [Candidatus Bathyarchaeota archaeon]